MDKYTEVDHDNWPKKMPRYIIENPMRDLLNREIDYNKNVLGNLWLERGTFGVILGASSIGKSVVAVQSPCYPPWAETSSVSRWIGL
jgi:hypothetical protein